jgi:protein TonB
MTNTSNDWKEVVGTYFDKCLSITILFTMFAFIVFPSVETLAIITTERIMETVEIMPEILERIEQPQEIIRPIVNIEIIDDDLGDDSDDDIIYITTIEVTAGSDGWVNVVPTTTHGTTSRFVIFEDAPVPTRRPQPAYTDALRRTGIQGTVILQVEVLIDGSIGAIEVLQSLMTGAGGFDELAIQAMRQWQFQPARSQGQPVAVWINQAFTFTLTN